MNLVVAIDVPGFTIAGQDDQAAVAIRENISKVRIGGRVLRSIKLSLKGNRRSGFPFYDLGARVNDELGARIGELEISPSIRLGM